MLESYGMDDVQSAAALNGDVLFQGLVGAMAPISASCNSGSSVRFDCPDCGRSYSHSSTLWSHRRYECGKEPQFQCPCCPHRSKLKKNLVKHIRSRHSVPASGVSTSLVSEMRQDLL
ncbi:Longitudinals lacking protein, isoforms A/B/D/L [Frankliniella fusca]|uniref:Longitudinals lacking protein, isoforms A/B/D/L n=1 Tax=Frankliniella fusca TaxID=407009 RepID=A0AAE1H610_9NEOP|nr:Longitudinals lacking protein, isoforms A/B/D/L [Frankliniella fusca]